MRTQLRKAAALALASSLALTAPALAAGFTDSASIVHREAVEALVERGAIGGRADGSFAPRETVSRAAMAKMVSLLLGGGSEEFSSPFPDVAGTWAERYIGHCYSLGLISGLEDGTFAPNGPITTIQAAEMLLTAAGRDIDPPAGTDRAQQIDALAREAGLYEGLSADPAAPLTRDDAAQLLYNALPLLTPRTLDVGGEPAGLSLLPDGTLLIADGFRRAVLALEGGETRVYAGAVQGGADVNGRPLGGYQDGPIEESAFALPWAIAPFLGGWAVSDAENDAVRLIRDGQVQTINAFEDPLSYPTGLAAGEDGRLYVADTHNGLIRSISASGESAVVARDLDDPTGLCWSGGALYIAETGKNRILCWRDGTLSVAAGSGEEGFADGAASDAQFSVPRGVAAGRDGTLYVADTGNSAVREIRNGQVSTKIRRDMALEEISYPVSPTALLAAGSRLYVCDSFSGTILVLETEI